tara:strand:- start:960 stop:1334 length:375 start_codon:yes stop_codon:yes gene_type:complete
MKLTRRQIRKIIAEEKLKILAEVSYGSDEARVSEMSELGSGPAGAKIRKAGERIVSASRSIAEAGAGQTGRMKAGLEDISEFVMSVGNTLSSVGALNEGESLTERLPTVSELKAVKRAIERLEK